MTTPRVALAVEVPGVDPSLDEAWFERVASAVLSGVRPGEALALDVLLCDDEAIRAMNHEYRGIDEATDVLSFGLLEGEEFPSIPGEPQAIGQLVVSYPTAMRQAGEHARETPYEVAHLVIHGTLHLFGYDHADAAGEAVMRVREDAALASLFGAADRRGWDHR